jgi:hypothetical protein
MISLSLCPDATARRSPLQAYTVPNALEENTGFGPMPKNLNGYDSM